MSAHMINGEFQSDKYPTCPRGKVPLSVKDPTAQDLLWEYAQRRRVVDAEFSEDLEAALTVAGYVHRVTDAEARAECERLGIDVPKWAAEVRARLASLPPSPEPAGPDEGKRSVTLHTWESCRGSDVDGSRVLLDYYDGPIIEAIVVDVKGERFVDLRVASWIGATVDEEDRIRVRLGPKQVASIAALAVPGAPEPAGDVRAMVEAYGDACAEAAAACSTKQTSEYIAECREIRDTAKAAVLARLGLAPTGGG